MKCAAELGALAVEDSLALNEGSEAIKASGRGISFDAQRRARPAMKNILASDQEANVRTGWHSETLVNLQLTNHAGLQVLICHQVALELVVRWDLSAVEILLGCRIVL